MREFNIPERRRVWLALSDLFLDTDIALLEDHIVKVLAESPFAISELDEILIFEVLPVCGWNIFSVAGEWAGFDEQWLEEKILKRRQSPFRWLHRFSLARVTVPLFLPYWKRIKVSTERKRNLAKTGDNAVV